MSSTLTILGCDGSHAGPAGPGASMGDVASGAASGYLVRDWSTSTTIWMDAGPGTFANLQRFCDPTTLDAVVLSHEHKDHWSDIEALVIAMRWTWPSHPGRVPLRVLAAPGIAEQLSEDVSDVFAWDEVADGQEREVGALRLRFSRTDHPPVTLAVRLQGESGSLGYSADSGPGWTFSEFGSAVDLALCEATYTSDFEGIGGHMSARQAGEGARASGAKRLVVTHRLPTIDGAQVAAEAQAAFSSPVETAAIGRGYSW